jgi:dynein heavy chain 2, cytosolic
MIRIGDKLVDYNKDFRLFLVSRNTSPDICPSAAAALTNVNFSVTQAGLSGQVEFVWHIFTLLLIKLPSY